MSGMLTPGRFAAPPDPGAVALDWSRRGYSCHRFIDPPGQRWEDFVHDCNEVVTVTAAPGDEVFIPKGARHSVRNLHDGTCIWLYGYD